MIFVQNWDEVVGVMLKLDSNQSALLERQLSLRKWYIQYMHAKTQEIEASYH